MHLQRRKAIIFSWWVYRGRSHWRRIAHLEDHYELLNCDPLGQHVAIGAASARLWFRYFPNLVLGCWGLGVVIWFSRHRGARCPCTDDFVRNAASGVYLWLLVLLPLILLPFGAIAHSVTDGMMHLAVSALRFAVFIVVLRAPSVTMATLVLETSWMPYTVEPDVAETQSGVAMRKFSLSLVGFELDGNVWVGRKDEECVCDFW
jgi:hypothetical protein